MRVAPERSTPASTPAATPAATPGQRRVARQVRRRLEQVVAGGEHGGSWQGGSGQGGSERDAAEWAELRGRLDAVGRRERGPAWREASLLTDLAFRQRPRRSHRQLRQIRERRLARGAGEDFDRLWTECRSVLAPYTLSPHGYRLALASRDAAALWRTVSEVTTRFGELGHPAFVVSGALLGLVRDGGLLAYDDDIDLAVLLGRDDSPEAAGAARAWRELRVRAVEAGVVNVEFEKRNAGHCRAATTDGLTIDLFPAWQSGDRLFVWPHTYGEVAATDVLPLEPRRLGGGSVVLVPRSPEPLLEANYGPDWRRPDPTYHFDWKRAHRRFAGFIGNLGSRSPAEGRQPGRSPRLGVSG